MVAIRTHHSLFTPIMDLYRNVVVPPVLNHIFLHISCIVLLCISCAAPLNQDGNVIFTAKSHKSFYNLEMLVRRETEDVDRQQTANVHSRRKRSVVFTMDEIDTLLSLHQEYRRDVNPEAANMEYMVCNN